MVLILGNCYFETKPYLAFQTTAQGIRYQSTEERHVIVCRNLKSVKFKTIWSPAQVIRPVVLSKKDPVQH